MNERIRELIKSLGIIPEDEHYEVAELIVRECIKITRPDTEYPNEGNDWEQGFHVGKEDAADYIQEHFGVKE